VAALQILDRRDRPYRSPPIGDDAEVMRTHLTSLLPDRGEVIQAQ
jgi:hypothetical protein